MRSTFTLFNSHLDLSHDYWSKIVPKGGSVIDATCGNGHDTLFLSRLCLENNRGELFAVDLQQKAIDNTRELLQTEGADITRVKFILGCHSAFEGVREDSVDLIVYNLGYLPGSDKLVRTKVNSTLESIKNGMKLVRKGGAISVTFYPGHVEGKEERDIILDWVSRIDPQEWSFCHHEWLNRKEAPSLLLMQKAKE